MKILVTGADGFTGKFFSQAAKLAGHEVVGLQANLTDKESIAVEVQTVQPAAVVHLAAISFVGHADNTAFYSVNVVGTTNLLSALETLDKTPNRVLVASSANIYGNCEASPINEDQPPAPVNHYAASKLAMEHMARTYYGRLPIVLTRPFNYTGPGQALSFVIPKLVDHFVRRATSIELGNLHVEREFNDVRMVCKAYLALLEHGIPGQVYNICSGQPYTLQHVLDTLVDLTGHQPEVQINSKFVRANEVHRLCGDPKQLQQILHAANFKNEAYTLRSTLEFMLEQHQISNNDT